MKNSKKTRLYLVCNAHIDPVWLWTWHEGAAEAVSTFRTAVEFCEKYDGFVFNHNEALLYQWIEEYAPALFERIRKQVEKGKWQIMGGWYLQPDTQMPSGESLVRQIEEGRKYFDEKFGVRPRVAMSVDSFGHTRGLVQILSKTGYDGYIVRRIGEPNHTFKWEGFDGSSVTGHILYRAYASLRGCAKQKIADFINEYIDNPSEGREPVDTGLVLWGIGDHGGGASIPDIEGIEELICERDDIEIVQASPEAFIDDMKGRELPGLASGIEHTLVGCYISMARIKRLHRQLENKIDLCEKISAHAELEGGVGCGTELEAAKRELMFCQFHDILPGSCIKKAEEDAIMRLGSGITMADKLITRSFFALCSGQERPTDGEIPVIAYNPHPYPVRCDLDTEFTLASQNWNEKEYTFAEVYDENGNKLPSQTVTPESSINLDWRKHIAFTAELEPCSVVRFNCRLEVKEAKSLIAPYEQSDNEIIIYNDGGCVKISKKTGLIESYTVDGTEYLKGAGSISVIKDNEDPWGSYTLRYADEIDKMRLMTDEEADAFVGYRNEKYGSVRVIENGDVRAVVQVFFVYDATKAIVEYTIPKNHKHFDVKITMLSNDVNRLYKYNIDTCAEGEFYGQTAFGTQKLADNGDEVVFHQWCSVRSDDAELVVMNNGTYAGSIENKAMKLTLLRTPVYSALEIQGRQFAEPERYRERIDMGERCFELRIAPGNAQTPDADALLFNQPPIVLSFFTDGEGKKPQSMARIDNANILMTACRAMEDNGYMLRLYNSTDKEQQTEAEFNKTRAKITFGRFEVKTLIYKNVAFTETNMLGE